MCKVGSGETRWKPNIKYDHVFVVIRENTAPLKRGRPVAECIDVIKIFREENLARFEADRLNELNQGKGFNYFYTLGRLERD
jgi:hypothetical protein